MKRIDKENYYLDIAETVLERSTSYRGSIGRRLRLPFSISQGGTFMIRNAIQRFMYGRYGNDPLNLFLMALYLLLYLAFVFTRFEPLYWAGFLLLTLTFFRLLSRNIDRRREENEAEGGTFTGKCPDWSAQWGRK